MNESEKVNDANTRAKNGQYISVTTNLSRNSKQNTKTALHLEPVTTEPHYNDPG